MGMVFPVSTHNYVLRYWLAAGGLNPGYYLPGDTAGTTGADVQLSVTPPPQMPATLEAGTIDGYLGRRAVEPGLDGQGHRPPDHRRSRYRRAYRRQSVRPDRGVRRGEPEHRQGADARADPRLDVARRGKRQEPRRSRQAPRQPQVCRRRRGRAARLDDRQVHFRPRRHRATRRSSTCSSTSTPAIRSTRTRSGS